MRPGPAHCIMWGKNQLPSSRLGTGLGSCSMLRQAASGAHTFPPHLPPLLQIYPQGQMTQLLDKVEVGDSVLFKGPKGRFSYTPNMKRAIGGWGCGAGLLVCPLTASRGSLSVLPGEWGGHGLGTVLRPHVRVGSVLSVFVIADP